MAYAPHVWNQLRNLTAQEFCRALTRDGWQLDTSGGSAHVYRKSGSDVRRVSIHVHPKKTFSPKMLQALLDHAGWTEDDLRRLKLIK